MRKKQPNIRMLFLLVMLCRLPALIYYYPCAMPADTNASIEQFMGYPDLSVQLSAGDGLTTFCDHLPFAYTLLFGITMQIGNIIGSQNVAFFILALLQTMLMTALILTALRLIFRHNYSSRLFYAAIGAYIAYPYFSVWTMTLIKDMGFSIMMLWLSTLMLCIGYTRGRILRQRRFCIMLTLAMFLFTLSKNQCIYILLLLFPLSLLLYRQQWRRLCLCYGSAFILFFGLWHRVVFPLANVTEVGRQEIMGTMFQQTARYVIDHPDDINPDEKTAINKVLPLDSLPAFYNPQLQDPVKFRYHKQASSADMATYRETWLKQGLRHPDSYINAVTDCCSAFFNPLMNVTGMASADLQLGDSITQHLDSIHSLIPDKRTSFFFLQKIPVLGILCRPGIAFWLYTLLTVMVVWRRRWHMLLPISIGIVQIMTLIVSPANGEYRYIMPLMWCLPILFYAFHVRKNTIA